ncbi:MAG: slipin family protein [Calditrichaeota bacterium]|nr:MAG: slipin family protein [Calditrichota bacterium]
MFVRRVKVRQYEKGLLFHDKVLTKVLNEGVFWIWGRLFSVRVQKYSTVTARINHPEIETMIKSGLLNQYTETVKLQDAQIALVWIDGILTDVLRSGTHAYWNEFHEVRIEVLDITKDEIVHPKISSIVQELTFLELVYVYNVQEGTEGVLLVDGKIHKILTPGQHLFWKSCGEQRLLIVDKREQTLEICGQELLTLDKVTLRINALITLKVKDTLRAVSRSEDYLQSLYKEAQLIVREVIGQQELESLLTEKEKISGQLNQLLVESTTESGIDIKSLKIKDIILPGDMRELMNKVVEARKTSEANLIIRREETASLRSQLNSAKILESSPVLMKLRELEVLERIAGSSELKVILGSEGLKDKIMKLI